MYIISIFMLFVFNEMVSVFKEHVTSGSYNTLALGT